MEKKFITAQEANERAKDYSGIDKICSEIENAATGGNFETKFLNIIPEDKSELELLGYTVVENPNEIFRYTVSWK